MKGNKEKGQYGYRNYHRKLQFAKVLFGAAMILIQLGARNFTDNDAAKNILTVMAVLSVLPTANVASPFLASWKYTSVSSAFYEKIKPWEENNRILYDLIITSREQILPMDVIIIHPMGTFAYCSDKKADAKKAETYLNDTFKAHRLDPDAKVIKDETAFFQRISQLKPASQHKDNENIHEKAALLKNLSM